MQSMLVVSRNKDAGRNLVLSLCKQSKTDKIDIAWHFFDKIVGIEDVRNFQKKTMLKPIKSKTKAVVIGSENGLTIEAQSALLKILEEPPLNTIIYIIVSSLAFLLATILSRCKIIELKDKSLELSREEIAQYFNILISLPAKAIGEKLKLAQDITRNKKDVIPWLEKMILVTREIILSEYKIRPQITNHKSPTTQLMNILISLQKAYTVIKTTNANQRLILENLLLRI